VPRRCKSPRTAWACRPPDDTLGTALARLALAWQRRRAVPGCGPSFPAGRGAAPEPGPATLVRPTTHPRAPGRRGRGRFCSWYSNSRLSHQLHIRVPVAVSLAAALLHCPLHPPAAPGCCTFALHRPLHLLVCRAALSRCDVAAGAFRCSAAHALGWGFMGLADVGHGQGLAN